jgi:hypothetical protein
MKDKSTDETHALLIAEAAGLDKVIAEFRDEVLAAAKAAASARNAFTAPDDPAVEPWPPMRVGGGV